MRKRRYHDSRFTPKLFPVAYKCSVCDTFTNVGRRRLKGFLCRSCLAKALNRAREVRSLRDAENRIREREPSRVVPAWNVSRKGGNN